MRCTQGDLSTSGFHGRISLQLQEVANGALTTIAFALIIAFVLTIACALTIALIIASRAQSDTATAREVNKLPSRARMHKVSVVTSMKYPLL